MKRFKYILSMILTFLHFPLMLGGFLLLFFSKDFWTYMYTNDKLNQSINEEYLSKIIIISIVVGIVMLVLNFIIMKPITNFRINAREDLKYDNYGRLKDEHSYKKLSVREQKELDAQRVREINRVLPSPIVKQMTKSGSSNPREQLNELIGLKEVKEKALSMMARMKFDQKNKKIKMNTAQHMVFYGPPGTGKTTVARIMTGFLYEFNYINRNELIEVNGTFFLDNEASKKMQAICQRAYGGVLFIDEAYSMVYSQEGMEAIAELIKNMEDSKDKFILILAGYKNEMKELIQSNPGFSSRIKEYVKFDNYSDKELFDIFSFMARKEGVENITDRGKLKFYKIIEDIKYDSNFGNARTVRSILDQSISKEALLRELGKSLDVNENIRLNENNIIYKKNELF